MYSSDATWKYAFVFFSSLLGSILFTNMDSQECVQYTDNYVCCVISYVSGFYQHTGCDYNVCGQWSNKLCMCMQRDCFSSTMHSTRQM